MATLIYLSQIYSHHIRGGRSPLMCRWTETRRGVLFILNHCLPVCYYIKPKYPTILFAADQTAEKSLWHDVSYYYYKITQFFKTMPICSMTIVCTTIETQMRTWFKKYSPLLKFVTSNRTYTYAQKRKSSQDIDDLNRFVQTLQYQYLCSWYF